VTLRHPAAERRTKRRAARSPLISLAAFRRLADLPDETLHVVAEILFDLRTEAGARANASWRARKAPMGAYWRHVAAHAGVIRRALGFQTGTCSILTPRIREDRDRNPILSLPSAQLLAHLGPAGRALVARELAALHADAADLAERSWPRNVDRAAYWRAASVYAGHLRRAVLHEARRDQHDLPLETPDQRQRPRRSLRATILHPSQG
jgi:hypothetical protein